MGYTTFNQGNQDPATLFVWDFANKGSLRQRAQASQRVD